MDELLEELTDQAGALPPQAEAPAGSVILPAINKADPRTWSRGVKMRRNVGIVGFVGLNGTGKSQAMVRDTIPSLAMGRKILSTVTLLDPHTGNPHPSFVPFQSWKQLHEDLRDTDILLDEITGIMDSRDSGMPKHVRTMLPQMRRNNDFVRWTGIDWDNAERRMRQLTKVAVVCGGYFPVSYRELAKTSDDGTLPMWRPNRLFSLVSYDAQTLKTSDDSMQLSQDDKKEKKAKVLNREWYLGARSDARSYYDTMAPVFTVSSLCPVCKGRIAEKTCKGHPESGVRAAAGKPAWA